MPYESAPPLGEIENDAVAAARVFRREREWVRGKERSSQPWGKPLFLHLSMDEEGTHHDRRCPVPPTKTRPPCTATPSSSQWKNER
jgi:hypothetical protein